MAGTKSTPLSPQQRRRKIDKDPADNKRKEHKQKLFTGDTGRVDGHVIDRANERGTD